MNTRDVIRAIEADGWVWTSSRGSHRHFTHPTKPGRVTVAFHGANEEIGIKTLKSIAAQAGITFRRK